MFFGSACESAMRTSRFARTIEERAPRLCTHGFVRLVQRGQNQLHAVRHAHVERGARERRQGDGRCRGKDLERVGRRLHRSGLRRLSGLREPVALDRCRAPAVS
jgi:hypothetical protein